MTFIKASIFQNDVKSNGLPDDCKAVVSLSGRLVLEPFKRYHYVLEITCVSS